MTLTEFTNLTLAVLALASQIFTAFSIVCLIFFKKKHIFVHDFLSRHGLFFAFLTALIATMGSLFYSEIAGYNPCALCWYQRIFMYPQVFLLGIALYRKDKGIIDYAIFLSIIGALIALYHYLMQAGIIKGLACSVIGYSVSCSKLFVMQLGYITIPLMAVTAFVQIIVFLYFAKNK